MLTITSKTGLTKVIGLINGHLRTPKIEQFNAMINWINKYPHFFCCAQQEKRKVGDCSSRSSSSSIPTQTVDNSEIHGNAWLAGFIDAEGSFDILLRLVQVQ